MKKAAIYCRVTADQPLKSQEQQLRAFAVSRGFEIVQVCSDRCSSGVKARRPGLDSLMADARQRKFEIVLVSGLEKLARSTKHLLQVLEELDELSIDFVSARESIDTSTEKGRMFIHACQTIATLERALSGEKIRQGMRRAEFEGQRLGRAPLDVDREGVARDRLNGLSLTAVAKKYGISRASVVRFCREAQRRQLSTVGGLSDEWEHRAMAAGCVA